MIEYRFYVDPSRCIGCKACESACAECETHRGRSMIHVDYLDRSQGIETVPTVCMHCDDPTCAEVCPSDAIKKHETGIVMSSLKPRCIACSNCVLACPFGVPKLMVELDQMMKCDMCFDRITADKRPMCATVCPSQALAYRPVGEVEPARREHPINDFQFGNERVTTRVFLMAPERVERVAIDVARHVWEETA